MTINGYTIKGEWKASQCGETALATKGGKTYFLKKYQTPVKPFNNDDSAHDDTLDRKTFKHNEELFERFLKVRKTVNSKIRAITGPGGNIVIPSEEFVADNHYMEAAEYVEGVVGDDELEERLKGLSIDVKKLLMQTAAGALASVHKQGIIHSDLKLKNVLLVKNSAGNHVAKLIDFDSSYPVDEKPEEIVGDINYYSPELGVYADIEDDDERAEAGKKLTYKSDIFSLGLIFHFYLSGELPGITDMPEKLRKRAEKGKRIYSWAALNNGAKLVISPKITGRKYRELIQDMLDIDPDKRPTALDVLKRLKEEDVVFEEPWPEDHIVFDIERIKSRGFCGIAKKTMGDIKGYEFYRPDYTNTFVKKDMALAMKYAYPSDSDRKADKDTASKKEPETETPVIKEPEGSLKDPVKKEDKTEDTCTTVKCSEPWPEHHIVFDEDKIKEKGFVSVQQAVFQGVKGYRFKRADNSEQFIRVEMVLIQKMAVKNS
ncbi:MAG: protein kinase [Lachnospiraceae bacterium]|nr:protein kinase [Lachnospiraceae bacterium]